MYIIQIKSIKKWVLDRAIARLPSRRHELGRYRSYRSGDASAVKDLDHGVGIGEISGLFDVRFL